jgi:hypothetical protein
VVLNMEPNARNGVWGPAAGLLILEG